MMGTLRVQADQENRESVAGEESARRLVVVEGRALESGGCL